MDKIKYKITAILLFFSFIVFAQTQPEYTVAGTVYDETEETLPGVNIYVKNTTQGVRTDLDGNFSIKVKRGSVLVFSYVGHASFEYFVEKEEKELSIILSSTSQLEEVIIVGMGASQRKISSVGAISTIDAEDLQVPASSMSNILGGRLAGIINIQTSGEPGKDISDFWVRGIGTFGASTSALVLIDGLEGDLNSIDPTDIESFSVLKDASATAVYGVRGANGVVLVTTKRGKEGKLRITARANTTISQLKRMPQYIGAYDYAKLVNEALVGRGNVAKYADHELDIIQNNLDPDLYPNVNWQKEILNPIGLHHNYYISGQGGGDIARYFVSLALSNQNAAYKLDKNSDYNSGIGYNTYGFRTNLDIKLTSTTKMYFGTDGYLTLQKQPGMGNTDYVWRAQAMLTPILVPLKYSTGELPAYGPTDSYSPYVMLNHTGNSMNQTYTGKVTLALYQDLDMLLKGLKLRLQGAYDNKSYFNEVRSVLPEMYRATGRKNGQLQMIKRIEKQSASYTFGQRQYRKYHFESTLNYENLFLDAHRISGLIYYYMSDQKDTHDISGTSVNASMSAIPKRYQGVSSRLTYGYNDTYLFDFNFGYTGSENFEPGRQFGFFPSGAIGWVPTQYEWTQENIPWVNFFKIRASYGTVGSDRITDKRFPYLTIISENGSLGWGQNSYNGITESTIGADNLMWERSIKTDVGVDAHLLKNKLTFTVDYFNDKRHGIFQQRQSIPGFAGLLAMPYGNVGQMRSYGADGSAAFNHKISEDLSFTVRGNFTYSRNKIENWEQAPQKYPYQSYNGYTNGAIRGYIALGLFEDDQDIASSPVQNFGSKVLPGDIKYKDVNGDGIIDADDKIALSDPTYPRLMYGLGGEIRYKNLTLGILLKGTGHTPFYHVGQAGNGMGYVPFHGGETGNVLTVAANPQNRWIPVDYALANGIDVSLAENPNARFPRLDYGYNANNSQLSTWWKGDGRYLRLQEITLNYNLTNKYIKRTGINSIDLQLVGSNLYVWDKVKLWDPEQANKNGIAYPIPAQYSLQVYLNF